MHIQSWCHIEMVRTRPALCHLQTTIYRALKFDNDSALISNFDFEFVYLIKFNLTECFWRIQRNQMCCCAYFLLLNFFGHVRYVACHLRYALCASAHGMSVCSKDIFKWWNSNEWIRAIKIRLSNVPFVVMIFFDFRSLANFNLLIVHICASFILCMIMTH